MRAALLQLIAISFLCGAVFCAEDGSEVVDAVKKYNKVLIEAYKTTNSSLLADVATSNEISRIDPVVTALISRSSIMISEQRSFHVKEVIVREGNAEVETEELWVYWSAHKKTGEITRPKQEIVYSIRYRLIRDDNKWKVDRLDVGG